MPHFWNSFWIVVMIMACLSTKSRFVTSFVVPATARRITRAPPSSSCRILPPQFATTWRRRTTFRLYSSTNSTAIPAKILATGDEQDHIRQHDDNNNNDDSETTLIPPWSLDRLTPKRDQRTKRKSRNNVVRVRQHVNPLARRYQLHTILSDAWPRDAYACLEHKPLFLDIGVGKGGFLLQKAALAPTEYNYLGLEIRPLAVQFALERLHNNPAYNTTAKGHLDFVGCNVNVDLHRLLALYTEAAQEAGSSNNLLRLHMVTIQFPDPHFKAAHAKRRVVTPALMRTLASFMPPGAQVFLQSDVQAVLDDMRERFRSESRYFQDQIDNVTEYYPDNILGIPTEREVSVLVQDLPVYRALFVRTEIPVEEENMGEVDDTDNVSEEEVERS